MSVTVGDELTFDRIMESLSDFDRASVQRVLASGRFGTGVTQSDVRNAREEGYQRGLREGRLEKQQPAAIAAARSVDPAEPPMEDRV
jgi:hypothetical protein